MPAIARGSSARSRRRQLSEDNIEDGYPTQRSRTEDVEDAEEAQPSRISRKNSKAPKSSTNANGLNTKAKRGRTEEAGASGDDEEENQQDGALPIDIKNFKDQPLLRADSRKISAVAQDWEQIRRNMRSTSLPLVEQVAVAMAEAGENKDGEAVRRAFQSPDGRYMC